MGFVGVGNGQLGAELELLPVESELSRLPRSFDSLFGVEALPGDLARGFTGTAPVHASLLSVHVRKPSFQDISCSNSLLLLAFFLSMSALTSSGVSKRYGSSS